MNLSPLLILTLVIGIIWFVPIVCRKIHVPSIVGFILAGIVIGPSVLGVAGQTSIFQILGSLGMLYIMFQSGSEIDINDFKQYKYRSLFFGLCTFFIPFGLGLITSRFLLPFGWLPSLLLGAMYGSHTLMTYPIVSRYGVQKNVAVNITVGATMVAIILSLMVLAIVEGWSRSVQSITEYAIQLALVVVFLFSVLWLFPRFARMFFKRYRDPISEFMVVMLMLVGSALLADLAGLEGILGAFLCGVSLNRLLPNRSPLMNRINFVGNSIFVPLFLISVGLMIDIHAFWSSWTTVTIAIVMIITKLIGKGLSAWIAQVVFRFSKHERQLIFGLTHATAAGTLAIVTIAYQMGILSSDVLNASVLMILVLCTTASFISEHAAKELALQESAKLESDHEDDYWLLTSVGDDLRPAMREIGEMASLDNIEIKQSADWQDVSNMVEHTSKSVIVYHESQPINTINRLVVAVPRYAEKERDFITCFGLVRRLAGELGAKVVFYAHPDTQVALQAMCRRPGKYLRASFRNMDGWEEVGIISQTIVENDMLVLLSSRKSTASYNPLFERIPTMLTEHFTHFSSMVVYPEQLTGGPDMDTLLMEIPPASTTWSIITRVKRFLRKIWEAIRLKVKG
ncbi:MAG: cation:proton antiporter [Paludibacteraceae bacterium]|nr:cation:proton antiporter [Paludibacteraceae bacterium]